jgi:prophage regulatory protein
VTILRLPDVRARTGISRTRIYRLEAEKRFPSRIRLGPNSVGWLESEIDEWIAARVRECRLPRGEDLAQPIRPES